MFNKHFNLILLLMNISLCLSEVTITPSEEIVIKEGDPLKIICSASEKVDFFFPKNITGLAKTSLISFSSESTDGTSKSKLERSKSVFGDTGWYGCVESSKNLRKLNERELLVTPDTHDNIEIKWVYVYVKSQVNPFTIDSKDYEVRGTEGRNLTLPCRPTSPEYNVTLSISLKANQSKAFGSIDYDPKIGFTIRDVKSNFHGDHICRIENQSTTKITIRAKIDVIIEVEHKVANFSYKEVFINEGNPLTIYCYSQKNVTFFYPKSNEKIISEATISLDYCKHFAKFERTGTVEGDGGWYGCGNFQENHGIQIINETPYTYHDPSIQWIYVYITNPYRIILEVPYPLKTGREPYRLSAEVGSDVVLPCRLWAEESSDRYFEIGLEPRDKKIKIDAEYDSNKGFILRNIQQNSTKFFECWATRTNLDKMGKFNSLHFESKIFEIQLTDKKNISTVGTILRNNQFYS